MQLHNLAGRHKRKKVVGRGGKRGTYSGRGVKGQKARSGHRIRPAFRDYIKQIPKLRGRGKNIFTPIRKKPHTVDVAVIESRFSSGDIVSPKTLFEKELVGMIDGRLPKIKILGSGKLTKKLTVRNARTSRSVKAAVEKAGGKILSD